MKIVSIVIAICLLTQNAVCLKPSKKSRAKKKKPPEKEASISENPVSYERIQSTLHN